MEAWWRSCGTGGSLLSTREPLGVHSCTGVKALRHLIAFYLPSPLPSSFPSIHSSPPLPSRQSDVHQRGPGGDRVVLVAHTSLPSIHMPSPCLPFHIPSCLAPIAPVRRTSTEARWRLCGTGGGSQLIVFPLPSPSPSPSPPPSPLSYRASQTYINRGLVALVWYLSLTAHCLPPPLPLPPPPPLAVRRTSTEARWRSCGTGGSQLSSLTASPSLSRKFPPPSL
ncbi:unnamed protein product [Closterium sp. NIES-54]